MIGHNPNHSIKNVKILWTDIAVNRLNNIMFLINKNKLMQPIGYIVRYYIDKHQPYTSEYKVLTVDNNDTFISIDTIILAYVCEIWVKKKIKCPSIIMNKRLIYKSLTKIFYETIFDHLKYDKWELNNQENYIINLISDLFKTERYMIKFFYYLSRKLIDEIKLKPTILNYMPNLIVRTQDLDISILNREQIRDFLYLFKSKRTLYVRIFLVITEYMIREKSIFNEDWLKYKIKIHGYQKLKEILNDPIIEILICLTVSKIEK